MKPRMSEIRLNDLAFYGYHGVFPEENTLGQEFRVNLVLFVDISKAAESDALKDAINYKKVFEAVKSAVEGKKCKLLETLATQIGKRLIETFPLKKVSVEVTKPKPSINGFLGTVSVKTTVEA